MTTIGIIFTAITAFCIALFAAFTEGVESAIQKEKNKKMEEDLNAVGISKKIDNDVDDLVRAELVNELQNMARKE